MKDCYDCGCYDPDLGCTMPSIDQSYACPLSSNDGDFENYALEWAKKQAECGLLEPKD